MLDYIEVGEADATRRRLLFYLRDSIWQPVTNAGGEQPQISVDWGGWASSGVSTLTHMSVGYYYATLDPATVAAAHAHIVGRFDNATTEEAMSLNRFEVGGYREALAVMRNDVVFDHAAGAIGVYDSSGYQGGAGNVLYTRTITDAGGNKTLLAKS